MTDGVQNVLSAVHEALSRASGSLLVRDAEFGDTLRMGQIIKGRVMRQYEGGRYLVDFAGQEKIVDSTIPLRTSELFNSRVVALGDQVHLQRLHDGAQWATELARGARVAPPGSATEQALQALFAEHNATLAPRELSAVAASARRVAHPELLGLGALLLKKMGLPMSSALLQALYRRLGATPQRLAEQTLAAAPKLTVGEPPTQGATTLTRLGEALQAVFRDSKEAPSGAPSSADPNAADDAPGPDLSFDAKGDGHRDPQREWALGQWLLGLQSHPRVAHRMLRIPIWFGDDLVEVSVALFSEAGRESADTSLHHRRVVFFVATQRLGQVQITVNAAQRHLRLEVATDSAQATDSLASHVAALQAILETLGWTIDEIQYLERDLDDAGAVLNNVVRHHIAQDSLSRLM